MNLISLVQCFWQKGFQHGGLGAKISSLALEEVGVRLGLCSLKFKFLFCFRAGEENRFSCV